MSSPSPIAARVVPPQHPNACADVRQRAVEHQDAQVLVNDGSLTPEEERDFSQDILSKLNNPTISNLYEGNRITLFQISRLDIFSSTLLEDTAIFWLVKNDDIEVQKILDLSHAKIGELLVLIGNSKAGKDLNCAVITLLDGTTHHSSVQPQDLYLRKALSDIA